MRRVWLALLAPLRSSAIVGAAYLLLVTWWSATHPPAGGDTKQLGEHASEITSFVEQRYGGEIHKMELAIVAAAVAIGAVLGVLAGGLARTRDRLARRGPRSWPKLALATLVGTALLHAWATAYGIARAPQLYTAWLYDRGGVARVVQVVVTDVLGTRGVVAAGALAIVLYLAGPLDTWRFWPARFRRAFGPAFVPRPLRGLGARGGGGGGGGKTGAFTAGAVVVAGVGLLAHALLPDVARAQAPAATSARPAPAAHPNVIILAADSLRADRVTPRTMPHVSAWMEHAGGVTSFDRAYVSLPRTFPSWVTLLTGRWPHHHGIRHMFPRWEARTKDFDALPERLARAGYRTGVVSDYAGDIFGRVDLGFQEIDTPWFDFTQLVRQRALERALPLLPFLHSRVGRRAFPVMREMNDAADPEMLADDVTRAIDRLSGSGSGDAPFFLTVFFSTAHFPYAAPAPYYRRFTDPSYRGRWKYHRPVGLGHDAAADAEDEAQVRALYDGAVSAIDDAYARVLDALAARGLDKSTIVVLAADHGETLFDHGRPAGHGDHLFGDEGTHIPLVVRDPRAAAAGAGKRSVASLVRDVDLAPTLYALTGVAPPSNLDGRSLRPALEGRALAPAPVFAETEVWFTEDAVPAADRVPYPGIEGLTEIDAHDGVVLTEEAEPLVLFARHRMVKDDRYKLVYIPLRAGPRYELFDTIADPAETKDLALALPDEVSRMKTELQAWMLQDPAMTLGPDGLVVPRAELVR